jgi:hypothetical protein
MKTLDFIVNKKWWFLGISLLFFVFRWETLGFILLIISVIGIVKTYYHPKGNNYDLPAGLKVYPDKVKKEHFTKCPVCKEGKIKKDSEKEDLFNCENCSAEFKKTDENMYRLNTKNCSDKYSDFQYNKDNFLVYEWNMIALTGKTLREYTLESFEKGDVPNLTKLGIDVRVALKSNEHGVWVEKSELHEPRSVREFKGGSRGVSVRVAKGVSVRLGNFKGQSESHEEMRHIDDGTLILTNKRIIFSSTHRSSNIDLRKILDLVVFTDGFRVYIENRKRPQFFAVSDPAFWHALLKGVIKSRGEK